MIVGWSWWRLFVKIVFCCWEILVLLFLIFENPEEISRKFRRNFSEFSLKFLGNFLHPPPIPYPYPLPPYHPLPPWTPLPPYNTELRLSRDGNFDSFHTFFLQGFTYEHIHFYFFVKGNHVNIYRNILMMSHWIFIYVDMWE